MTIKLQNRSERYTKGGGQHCPSCGTDDIEGGQFTADTGYAVQPMGCNECEAEWEDVYTLQGIENAAGFDPAELTEESE